MAKVIADGICLEYKISCSVYVLRKVGKGIITERLNGQNQRVTSVYNVDILQCRLSWDLFMPGLGLAHFPTLDASEWSERKPITL